MKLPMPEKRSFMTTISVELLLLIIFVQLFSNPQQIQAPNTQNAPSFSANAPAPSKLRIILAIVTIKIASHSFLDITSLKTTRAIMEVATISKLFSSGTLADQAWNPSFFQHFQTFFFHGTALQKQAHIIFHFFIAESYIVAGHNHA